MAAGINTFLKAGVSEGTMPFEIKTKQSSPQKKCRIATLNHEFIVKNDEFYTQYEDVAKEMVKHGDKLRGKTVLCNCDDPFESAFFRYFALHFNKIGLAKLISISYAGSPMAGKEYPLEEDTSAYEAVVTEVPDEPLVRPDSSLDLEIGRAHV